MSFKNGPEYPVYDPYQETDLDIGDQLIDYSKRYADPNEVCDPSLTDNQKLPEDEMKVYCMEGTPLLISSASSMYDLREIGNLEPVASKDFPISKTDACNEAEKNKKPPIVLQNDNEECAMEEEKDQLTSKSERGSMSEANGTKASSPMMFSRSSSVGSLNSCEQHSIMDDRSSISAFSTLMSGVISPSEIPDSPGGIMSPCPPKNDKQISFQFPAPDNTTDLKAILDQLKKNTSDFISETFENLDSIPPEDDVKVYHDEGECSAMSSLSALSMQTNSIRVTVNVKHKASLNSETSAARKESGFKKTFSNESRLMSSQDSNLIRDSRLVEAYDSDSRSVEARNQNNFNGIEENMSHLGTVADKIAFYSNFRQVYVNDQRTGTTFTINPNTIVPTERKCKDIGTSTSEDFELIDGSYQFHQPARAKNTHFNMEKELTKKNDKIGDDENDDALLEACIQSGMPIKAEARNSFNQSANHSYSTESSFEKLDKPQNSSYSDNEVSDEESDFFINHCIQLGKSGSKSNIGILPDVPSIKSSPSPLKHISPTNQKLNQKHFESSKTNHDSELDTYVKPEMPKRSDLQGNLQQYPVSLFNQSFNIEKQDMNKTVLNRNEITTNKLERMKQLKMHLNFRRTGYHPSNTVQPNTAMATSLDKVNNLGYRDNCPDGTSDDEDDDDILSACIQAGRPNEKTNLNSSKTENASQNHRTTFIKEQSPLKDRAMSLKKSNYNNFSLKNQIIRNACSSTDLIEVEDSTCVYLTEDTPLLSPTASLSDLSTLSFAEDKSCCQESFLNNSRNSDCSEANTDSDDDDELLLQCIESGRPGEKRI